MQLTLALLTCAALINSVHAQTSATIYVLSTTQPQNSAYGYMTTSFLGLKLPTGGGTVSVTITPGDWATGETVTSYADHSQAGPYQYLSGSTSFTIGATGHYFVYLSSYGSSSNPINWDWLEINVVASTYSGTISCYYCQPPLSWASGWPPLASHQETGVVVIPSNQPGTSTSNMVPSWVVPVLAVVIAVATLLPISYCLYRRHQQNKAQASTSTSAESSTVELQSTSVDVPTATAV